MVEQNQPEKQTEVQPEIQQDNSLPPELQDQPGEQVPAREKRIW